MGLLIGASVITLFEAVDAFTITLARKKRRPRRQPNQEAENEIFKRTCEDKLILMASSRFRSDITGKQSDLVCPRSPCGSRDVC